jgi:hypothetical protein
MKLTYLAFILFLFSFKSLQAQSIKGTVSEAGGSDKIENVFVRDMNSKEVALTDKKGNFEIKTAIGHTLILYSPGYVTDTLYVVDMEPKQIRLLIQGISLKQVNITSSRLAFNPREEYADVYTKSRVYVMSPSTWFGKEGRDARRLKKFFDREEKERKVDQVFTRSYVGSLVPLKGQELEDFMTLYRPTYAFIIANNGPSLAVFVNDSYKKFMALPPEKRIVPKLSDVVK